MKKFAQLISLALIAVMCVALLASCAPASDPDKAEKALKDAGYTAAVDKKLLPAGYKVVTGKDIDAVVTGTKTDGDKNVQHVTIVYFANAEDAKAAYEKLKDDSDKDKKDADESEWVFAKSGKMVYWGTKTAVKDAR